MAGPWQAGVGKRRIGGRELRIAIGRHIDAVEGLIVQRVTEGERNVGYLIVPVIAAVRIARDDTTADLRYIVLARAGWRSAAENYSAGTVRQSHRARGARLILVRGDVWVGHASLRSVSLRQREWDRAEGQQQKQIKCASDEMSFDSGINLLFHFGAVLVICREVT